MQTSFAFEMNAEVAVSENEKGKIIGRAEYIDRPNLYWVKYVNGTRSTTTDWFQANELTLI